MKTGDLLHWYPVDGEPWSPTARGCLAFWCPACQEEHPYQINHGHNWHFDGNFAAPTFSPSLLIIRHRSNSTQCHLYVRNGQIEYCRDCPHELAGKTVPMVPWDEATNYWKDPT